MSCVRVKVVWFGWRLCERGFREVSFEGSCFKEERWGVACCGARENFGGGSCNMTFSIGGWVGYKVSLLDFPRYLFFLNLLWFPSPPAVLTAFLFPFSFGFFRGWWRLFYYCCFCWWYINRFFVVVFFLCLLFLLLLFR